LRWPIGRPKGAAFRIEHPQCELAVLLPDQSDAGEQLGRAGRASPSSVAALISRLAAHLFDVRAGWQQSRASTIQFGVEIAAHLVQAGLQRVLKPLPFYLADLANPTVLQYAQNTDQND
jgi:hypothetical protein